MIQYLTERGQLDPQVEQLPNHRQIAERGRAGEGLTKPELAIVLAYVKMGLFRRLLETGLPDEPYFRSYLDGYFPGAVRARFEGAVRQHRLRREITATQMTNRVVDLLGITFVHRMIRDTGASPLEVVRAALIALELLDVFAFVARLEAVVDDVPAEAELRAYEAVAEAVDGVVRWMLLNDLTGSDVEAFVDAYRGPLAQVRAQLADLLPTPERRRWVKAAKGYATLGLPQDLADEVAGLDYLPSSMGVVEVARRTGASLVEAGTRFFALGERLRLGWLRDRVHELPADDKWSKIALGGLVMDLRRAQQDLAERFVRARIEEPKLGVDGFLGHTPNVIKRYDAALAQIVEDEALSLASAGVVVRLLAQAR